MAATDNYSRHSVIIDGINHTLLAHLHKDSALLCCQTEHCGSLTVSKRESLDILGVVLVDYADVGDIAVDVLTETLVSETATEAYDTLAEMSAWIKSHPEDAAAMNTAIQKNVTDIQSKYVTAALSIIKGLAPFNPKNHPKIHIIS